MSATIKFFTLLGVYINTGTNHGYKLQNEYTPTFPIVLSGQPYVLKLDHCFTSNCGNVTFIINTTHNSDYRICPDISNRPCNSSYSNVSKTFSNGRFIYTVSSDICSHYRPNNIGWDDPAGICLRGTIGRTNGEEIQINNIDTYIEWKINNS